MCAVLHSEAKRHEAAEPVHTGVIQALLDQDEGQPPEHFSIILAYIGVHHYCPVIPCVQEDLEDYTYTARDNIMEAEADLKKAASCLLGDTPFRQLCRIWCSKLETCLHKSPTLTPIVA